MCYDAPVSDRGVNMSLGSELAEAKELVEFYKKACEKMEEEICQTLGQVLGFYPWYKDDQKNFPGATEKDGVCVGDHVAESIAMEAAAEIIRLRLEICMRDLEKQSGV